MKFAKRFVAAFAGIIVAVLSCFDRVIFKGYLPFGGEQRLNSWVDYGLKMKRKDFLPFLEQHSQALVEHAKALAERAGRPYEYRQGKFQKEKFIQELIRTDRLSEGRRRRANAVTRSLKRLHVRGLLAKIPRTRRWRVTACGQQLLGTMIQLHYHGLPLPA